MKTRKILVQAILVLFGQILSNAQDVSYDFKDSATVDDLFARVYYPSNDKTNLLSDKSVIVCFMTHSNAASTIFFPKPEYMCRMQLSDDKGANVPRSSIGETFGRKFSDLTNYSSEVVNKRGYNTGGDEKPDSGAARVDGGTSRKYPPVAEMFKMNASGNYKLSLEFQVFKVVGNGTNYHFKLVRLPPIDVSVVNH